MVCKVLYGGNLRTYHVCKPSLSNAMSFLSPFSLMDRAVTDCNYHFSEGLNKRRVIIAVGIYVALCLVGCELVLLLTCLPVQRHWEVPSQDGKLNASMSSYSYSLLRRKLYFLPQLSTCGSCFQYNQLSGCPSRRLPDCCLCASTTTSEIHCSHTIRSWHLRHCR